MNQVISTLQTCVKANELPLLLSVTAVDPTYFYTQEEKKNLMGPCAWAGYDGRNYLYKTPEKALKYVFQLTVPNEKVETVQTYLNKNEIPHAVKDILLCSKTITRLVKEPWYDEVLAVIRKYKPNFDESQINGYYNCEVDQEREEAQDSDEKNYDEYSMTIWMCSKSSDVIQTYDKKYRLITFSLMNSEIVKKLDDIVSIWKL